MKKPSEDLQIPESKWLNIEDFEYLCFDLAKQLMDYGEPIPDYCTRDNNLLDSSLNCVKQSFNSQLLYPTLTKQATILFYTLIKNHPFKNGNKRIAVMSLLAFLSLNKKWLTIDPKDLYSLAYFVSDSKTKERNDVLKRIEESFESNLTIFPDLND